MRAPAAARAGAGLALLQLTAIDCYVQSTSASALMPVMLVASRWGFSQAERSALLPAAAGRSRSTPTCAPSWLAARWVWGGGRPAGSAAHRSLPAVLVLFSPVVGCLLQPQSCCAFCAWDLQAAKMAGSRPGTGATAGSVIAVQAERCPPLVLVPPPLAKSWCRRPQRALRRAPVPPPLARVWCRRGLPQARAPLPLARFPRVSSGCTKAVMPGGCPDEPTLVQTHCNCAFLPLVYKDCKLYLLLQRCLTQGI